MQSQSAVQEMQTGRNISEANLCPSRIRKGLNPDLRAQKPVCNSVTYRIHHGNYRHTNHI